MKNPGTTKVIRFNTVGKTNVCTKCFISLSNAWNQKSDATAKLDLPLEEELITRVISDLLSQNHECLR